MNSYTGGCSECGLYTTTDIHGYDKNGGLHILCRHCYDKIHSPQAIRQQKIEKLLHKSVSQQIKEFFNEKIKIMKKKKSTQKETQEK